MFINVVFLVGICFVIIYFNVNNHHVVNWVKAKIEKIGLGLSDRIIDSASRLAPTIIVSVSNGLVDPITQMITYFENWDFSYERIN